LAWKTFDSTGPIFGTEYSPTMITIGVTYVLEGFSFYDPETVPIDGTL